MLTKDGAIQGVHHKDFSPSSVQLKREINGAFLCKRHQQRHLELCTVYLLRRHTKFTSALLSVAYGLPSPKLILHRTDDVPTAASSQHLLAKTLSASR
jgi:hypothetical protein